MPAVISADDLRTQALTEVASGDPITGKATLNLARRGGVDAQSVEFQYVMEIVQRMVDERKGFASKATAGTLMSHLSETPRDDAKIHSLMFLDLCYLSGGDIHSLTNLVNGKMWGRTTRRAKTNEDRLFLNRHLDLVLDVERAAYAHDPQDVGSFYAALFNGFSAIVNERPYETHFALLQQVEDKEILKHLYWQTSKQHMTTKELQWFIHEVPESKMHNQLWKDISILPWFTLEDMQAICDYAVLEPNKFDIWGQFLTKFAAAGASEEAMEAALLKSRVYRLKKDGTVSQNFGYEKKDAFVHGLVYRIIYGTEAGRKGTDYETEVIKYVFFTDLWLATYPNLVEKYGILDSLHLAALYLADKLTMERVFANAAVEHSATTAASWYIRSKKVVMDRQPLFEYVAKTEHGKAWLAEHYEDIAPDWVYKLHLPAAHAEADAVILHPDFDESRIMVKQEVA